VILRRNFGLKLLAVALAIVGWAYFRFATNPVLAARFDQQLSVPITAIDLPVGFIAHFTEKQAVVTVESHRGEAPVKPDELKAVLDLTGKTSGVYNVPVQLVAPSVVVQSLSPASETLTVEKIEQKQFPVALHYTGAQSAVVVGDVSVTPAAASVQGPASVLSLIASLRLDVALPTQPMNFDEMIRPIPVDVVGAEIPGVQVSPDLVRVHVRFVSGTGGKHN
jgi:YbbR domain-containing protein